MSLKSLCSSVTLFVFLRKIASFCCVATEKCNGAKERMKF